MISFQELQKHTSEDDLWTLIHGTVYDITEFVHQHPGGKGVILKTTGRDATQAFSQVHSIDILQMLPSSAIKGKIIISTVPKQLAEEKSKEVIRPPIGSILNMADFEALAEKVMAKEAWAYYSSAADDEITVKQNQTDFQKFPLKPKALVNVKDVDPSTTLFGVKSSLPIYITATAMGKLGHPAGEVNFTKAAGKKGIIQMIPTLSSCSLDEMTSARIDGQTQWLTLFLFLGSSCMLMRIGI
jgi:L-lactate dehydrogenase (cytochrome)